MPGIPAQTYMLHTHEIDATDAAYGEQTATNCCSVGNDIPVGTIDGHIAHSNTVERDVGDGNGESIDNATQQSGSNTHQPHIMDVGVEP